ncbi:hypothetical protein FRC03_008161 [Tulasnella sp. 419]|nr:hypothetical protein FRC02_011566 [Tulasnella sp. 418]KAG8959316.1 hypothetical protein FRC03_008161 [Tulasnella sp. 419]
MKFMTFPELTQLSQALSHSSQECNVHTRIEAYSCKQVRKDKKLTRAMEHSFQDLKAEIKQSIGSPEEDDESLFASPFGHLNKPQSRKTLYLLISLLNIAFPDYDFSEAKPDHFCKEVDGSKVLSALSTTLYSVRTRSGPRLVYSPQTYSAYPPTSPDLFSSSLPKSSPPKPSFISQAKPLSSSPPHLNGLQYSSSHPLSFGIHPMLYQVLDKVIKLEQCEVYSYTPDMDSDPHADDSDTDSDTSSSSPDDEDYDEIGFEDFSSSSPPKHGSTALAMRKPYGSWDDDEALPGVGISPDSGRHFLRKRKGGLLWSSHWFFHNKKMKRILFITIWAKKSSRWVGPAEDDSFSGWEGAVGAGARALGL